MLAQGRCIDLEELITWVHIENGLQGLGGVAVGHHACASHDIGDTTAHLRNLAHRS